MDSYTPSAKHMDARMISLIRITHVFFAKLKVSFRRLQTLLREILSV
jgi:hypothetical protein